MQTLTDWHGLFNCSRLEEPFDLYPDNTPEKTECSVCPKQATREIKYLTPATGKVATLCTCDECFYEDALWENREIIKTTNI